LAFSKQRAFSGFIIKLATIAVTLSVAVMIVSTAFVNGFKSEIQRKVFGFMGHIQISSFESNYAFETKPINYDANLVDKITNAEGVSHIHAYATKTAILKTDEEMEGIALKGIGTDFDWKFFNEFIVDGKNFDLNDKSKSNEIVISKTTADRLNVKTGDKISAYFIQDPVRIRRFTIAGLFNTGLMEYDEAYALVDIGHIKKLSDWQDNQIQGYEVFVKKPKNMEAVNDDIFYNELPPNLLSQTLKEINPSIFDWLELQNMNEKVIFALMIIVAVINMITTLLILIMERTNMIGIMKALGADNWSIRKLFLINAAWIIGFGLLFGNFLGLILCFLQYQFEFIKLPEESYFLNVVPVAVNWLTVFFINLMTFIVCLAILILPSFLITRITPVKAIRFD